MKKYEWPYVFVDTDWKFGDLKGQPIFTVYRVQPNGKIVAAFRDLGANEALLQIQQAINFGFFIYPNNNRNIAAVISRVQLPNNN